MARIGVVTINLGGHYRPAERLAASLVRAGHEVTIWAPASLAQEIRQLGAVPVIHEPRPLSYPWASLAVFAARQGQATEECLPDLLQELLDARVDAVVCDVHTPWGRVAAEYLGLPLVVSNPLYPYWALPRSTYRSGNWRLEPNPDHRRAREAVLAQWGVDLGPPGRTVGVVWPTTVGFSTPAFLGSAPPPGWCLAGPLMPELPRTPVERPFVYAALGTFTNASPITFATIIKALGQLDVDAVVATGGHISPDELAPYPDNVSVQGYVDSRAMLARASVHVTHGGAGSIFESLVAGVPMVCLPINPDQGHWSARVVACGAGALCRYQAGEIRAAVEQQLSPQGGGEVARRIAADLRAYPGDELVAEMFETVLAGETDQPVGGSGLSSSSRSGDASRASSTGTS